MAIHNTYDHALKVLARTYPDHFLSLTLPNQPVKLDVQGVNSVVTYAPRA